MKRMGRSGQAAAAGPAAPAARVAATAKAANAAWKTRLIPIPSPHTGRPLRRPRFADETAPTVACRATGPDGRDRAALSRLPPSATVRPVTCVPDEPS